MSIFESGTKAARALTGFFTGSVGETLFDESIQLGAAAASWAKNSGTPLALPGTLADWMGSQAMNGIGAGKLNHAAMLADLVGLFNQGPTAIVVGDVTAQLKREFAGAKKAVGLPLGAQDAANILSAIDGVNASRLYPRAYEFIYEHIKGLASEKSWAGLGRNSLYAPSQGLIDLSKSFDEAQIPNTVAFLRDATRNPDAMNRSDFNAQLQAAMDKDGDGAYGRFSGKIWEFIYNVAFKASTGFLKEAVKSIPETENYILSAANNGKGYYDTLVEAPTFIRALVYISEANAPGHFLNGAHVAFPPAASANAGKILDGYLQTVLGDDGAAKHPFYSANRARVNAQHPVNVQADFERQRSLKL